MKSILTLTIILIASHVFAQPTPEAEILSLSKQMFNWEVENKIDSLVYLFDEKLSIINSRGEIQTKSQYLNTLRSGSFKHDSINVEQHTATIKNTTAIVTGKGKFNMTLSGNKLSRHLSYMKVFTKDDSGWKLIALYASGLPD